MRDEALKKRLREIYESQGLTVTDRILDEGIKALKESRFAYTPPPPSFSTFMAKLWIRRRVLGPALAILIAVIVLFVGWQVWRAGEAARVAEQIRIEIPVVPGDIQEHRERTAVADRIGGRGKRERRGNDLVTASNTEDLQGEVQGGGSTRQRDRVRHTDGRRQLTLERIDVRPQRCHPV